MFTASNMLQKYLAAQPRDMYDIVGALMGYINADPYFKTTDFDDAIRYVLAHGVTEQELFETFNYEIDFIEDETKWSEEYYSYARVYLKDNFCKKRIEHIKAVARKLQPLVQPVTISKTASSNSRVQLDNTSQVRSVGGQREDGKKQQDHRKKHAITQQSVNTKVMGIIGVAILVVVIVFIIGR